MPGPSPRTNGHHEDARSATGNWTSGAAHAAGAAFPPTGGSAGPSQPRLRTISPANSCNLRRQTVPRNAYGTGSTTYVVPQRWRRAVLGCLTRTRCPPRLGAPSAATTPGGLPQRSPDGDGRWTRPGHRLIRCGRPAHGTTPTWGASTKRWPSDSVYPFFASARRGSPAEPRTTGSPGDWRNVSTLAGRGSRCQRKSRKQSLPSANEREAPSRG